MPTYDSSQGVESQAAAFIDALPPSKSFRYGLELVATLTVVGMIGAVAVHCLLPRGLVALRPIEEGTVIKPEDVVAIPMPAEPAFRAFDEIKGLIALTTIEAGRPLRPNNVGAAYAVAAVAKEPGEVITAADVKLERKAFLNGGVADRSMVGRVAQVSIPAATPYRHGMFAVQSGRIACRDIEPFRVLTAEDVNNPPPSTCSVASVPAGGVLRDSQIVSLDATLDTVTVVKLGAPPARAVGTAMLVSKDPAHRFPVQILGTRADGQYVLACRRGDVQAIAVAENLLAFQEIQ